MNRKNIFPTLSILISCVALFSSCLKSRPGETDFSQLKPILQIPEGGMQNFGSSSLNFTPTDTQDTAWFHINYAAKTVAAKDQIVTITIDTAAMTAYNNDPANKVKYQIFPDSIYKFKITSVTIKAGSSYSDAIPLVVYPNKIDPTVNYMLPISIKDAQGNNISGNFGTIYYHLIGNPLAGAYKWNWTRYNSSTPTGTPTASSFTGASTIFLPDDPNTVEVQDNYGTAPRFVIHFDNNGGVLSNFTVSMNPTDVATMAANNLSVTSAPVFTMLDPVNKVFQIEYQAFNGTSFRYLIDKYYK